MTVRNKNTLSVFSTIGASGCSDAEREENDYYATDPKALTLLLENEEFSDNVWECACGEGHLSNVLIEHGYNTYSTDIVDRGYGIGGVDFLAVNTPFDGDIITNPPYKYAKEFVEHALDLIQPGQKVAMFLKLQFLESRGRRPLFDRKCLKTVWVTSGRINCCKSGDFSQEVRKKHSSALAYAWFIFEKGYFGDPVIKWFN